MIEVSIEHFGKAKGILWQGLKARSVETNAIKCCLGHLVICVEVLSLLSPSTPDTIEPESAGSERPPAAQIAARTTTERKGREGDRQRRTRTSRSPFLLRARPAGKSGGKRHPQSERDDRRGEVSHAVNNKHKQQQTTASSAAEDGHLAGEASDGNCARCLSC